jgi:hypothetical protein
MLRARQTPRLPKPRKGWDRDAYTFGLMGRTKNRLYGSRDAYRVTLMWRRFHSTKEIL